MRMFEFQAKRVFREEGIPVPKGELATNAVEVEQIARELGGPVALKAQVLVGGRGLTGGVKFADNVEEARMAAERILSSKMKGENVRRVLVEEKMEIKNELYVGVTIDQEARAPIVVATSEGGVEIELVSEKSPEKIVKRKIDVFKGLSEHEARSIAKNIGLDHRKALSFSSVLRNLYGIFEKYDAELVEINPLALTVNDKFVAVDAKLNLDDRAAFRHKDLICCLGEESIKPTEGPNFREYLAKEADISSYVELDGNIGIISDGAGTGMLALDLVEQYGGRPADFCELGGFMDADMMRSALNIVSSNPNVKVILITLIGGLTRMDEMAEGIAKFIEEKKTTIPIVVRLTGTSEEEGRRILKNTGINSFDDMYDSIGKAVKLAGEN
ncbi:MAG: ADP-forming succinate--CoA ligase subunit beta [Candidatus Bathyarchaeota archaeon]|nr:ADP-forming succinate--CoA ligase subunit beta [Candidatus Bathyarchaeota archaeon]MDH5745356.1 ADP-forming succinate--CoA ligase subunit beta [Candidatus Bathyarchaeota archaeon]